jgi:sec-independent protein translocase protein TatA
VEIFGVGLPEILMIAVVALIVLGPERLPEAARAAGKALSDLRKAVEPARSAWTELSSELTSVTDSMAPLTRATIKASRPGEITTAIPVENPWKIHPITEGMSDDEREHFMATGVIPPHILAKLDEKKATLAASSNNGSGASEPGAFDYPAPHKAPPAPVAPQAEDLFYPAPPSGKTVDKDQDRQA